MTYLDEFGCENTFPQQLETNQTRFSKQENFELHKYICRVDKGNKNWVSNFIEATSPYHNGVDNGSLEVKQIIKDWDDFEDENSDIFNEEANCISSKNER